MAKKAVFTALFFLFLSSAAFSAKIEVFTADNIVQLIKDKTLKTKTFIGSFVYVYNQKTYWGVIKYKAPGKFMMNYMDKNSTGGDF